MHLENRQANTERNANKRGFGMSNVNEKNKRINFLNAYQNVSSAPENQKVRYQLNTHLMHRLKFPNPAVVCLRACCVSKQDLHDALNSVAEPCLC